MKKRILCFILTMMMLVGVIPIQTVALDIPNYITDIGMTGPTNSILGVTPESVIEKMRTHMPHRFTVADGPIAATGALFDVDPVTGKAISVTRVKF